MFLLRYFCRCGFPLSLLHFTFELDSLPVFFFFFLSDPGNWNIFPLPSPHDRYVSRRLRRAWDAISRSRPYSGTYPPAVFFPPVAFDALAFLLLVLSHFFVKRSLRRGRTGSVAPSCALSLIWWKLAPLSSARFFCRSFFCSAGSCWR